MGLLELSSTQMNSSSGLSILSIDILSVFTNLGESSTIWGRSLPYVNIVSQWNAVSHIISHSRHSHLQISSLAQHRYLPPFSSLIIVKPSYFESSFSVLRRLRPNSSNSSRFGRFDRSYWHRNGKSLLSRIVRRHRVSLRAWWWRCWSIPSHLPRRRMKANWDVGAKVKMKAKRERRGNKAALRTDITN